MLYLHLPATHAIRWSKSGIVSLRLSPALRQPQSKPRHHCVTRLVHWSTVILLIVAAASICARAYTGNRTVASLLLTIHETSGVAVLLLTAARLAWRVRARVGAVNANLPRLLRVASSTGHLALYAALLVLTTLGWLTADAFGNGVRLFGVLPLPHLIAHDRDLADDLQEWHAGAAWLLLALIVAHVAAALLHHFVRRDDVLRSMQPFTSRVRPRSIGRLRALLAQRRIIRTATAAALRKLPPDEQRQAS